MPTIKTATRSFTRYVHDIYGVILVFLFIYPLIFTFLPGLSTRIIMGILGIIGLFRSVYWKLIKTSGILKWLIIIVLISVVSIIINSTHDFEFVKFCLSMIIIFAAASWILTQIRKRKGHLTPSVITDYIICAVDVQMCLVVIFAIMPSVKDIVLSYIVEDLRIEEVISTDASIARLVGLGTQFFGAGIINSAALICVGSRMKEKNFTNCIFYIISFFLIGVVGIIMSRTTMIGAGISLFMLFYKQDRKQVFKAIRLVVLTFIVIILALFMFPIKLSSESEAMLQYGFELFYNYSNSGSMESPSTNRMFEMYETYPTDIKTWIIGDAMYSNPSGGYYMNIDIGYLRLLFYFGIIGTLAIIMYHYRMYKLMARISGQQVLALSFLLLYFAVNFKGYTHLTPFFCLYFFSTKPQILPKVKT